MRIFKNSWFSRFSRKEGIPDQTLREAVKRAENDQIEADLGGGVIKLRVAGSGRGKSKGYRTILLFRKAEKAFFVYGFAKSDRANLREDEEAQFKKMAKHVLALSDAQLQALIAAGQFEELESHGNKVSK